jgi:hypothetical protein
VAGNHDHRQIKAEVGELALHSEAIDFRHLDIEQYASRRNPGRRLEKRHCRFVPNALEVGRIEQLSQRSTNSRIIVDNMDNAFSRHH